MSEHEEVATATYSSGRHTYLLAWVVPMVAVAIAGWLVWRSLPDSSATVELRLANAEGVLAGTTLVKHRGVPIGMVDAVALTDDAGEAVLSVDLDEGFGNFARTGASYWIVQPELDQADFSSLRTIVSGPYIAASPGAGEPRFSFDVLPQVPLDGIDENALRIELLAAERGTINRGAPVTWRGITIGRVTGSRLVDGGQAVYFDAGIFNRYRHLVRTNSLFWSTGGISVSFGLFQGAEVKADSVQSLLQGSVGVATPEPAGELLEGGESFTLQPQAPDGWKNWTRNLARDAAAANEQ